MINSREDAQRRTGALLLTIAGTAFAAFAIVMVYVAMRSVMIENGGFCAKGGPYRIAPGHECSDAAVGLLMGGIVGGLAAAGLAIGAAMRAGGAAAAGTLAGLAWAGLFGALGWNFIELGFAPPGGNGRQVGWIVPGILFWLMAVPGVAPLLAVLLRPPAGTAGPGTGLEPASPPHSRARGRSWLAAVLAGLAAGVIAGASIVPGWV